MVKEAKSLNLPLSIEPHMDSMVQTAEKATKLLDEVPDLQLTLDWAHLICNNVTQRDIVKLLPHTRHIQIRQAARSQLQVPFQRGRIKIDNVIEELFHADYAGIVCVEYMQTVGWHGMMEVDSIQECVTMRDELRDARNAYQKVAST
jgi:sugar phosphate isomerase/epimerase